MDAYDTITVQGEMLVTWRDGVAVDSRRLPSTRRRAISTVAAQLRIGTLTGPRETARAG